MGVNNRVLGNESMTSGVTSTLSVSASLSCSTLIVAEGISARCCTFINADVVSTVPFSLFFWSTNSGHITSWLRSLGVLLVPGLLSLVDVQSTANPNPNLDSLFITICSVEVNVPTTRDITLGSPSISTRGSARLHNSANIPRPR